VLCLALGRFAAEDRGSTGADDALGAEMAQTDVRALPRNDQVFLGLGLLILIASFLPWYGASYSASFAGQSISGSASENAWHSYAALGLLLMLAATVLVAVEVLTDATMPALRVSWNVVVVVLDVVGAVLIIIRSLDLPSASAPGFSVGLRWGGWILIIAAVAQVVFAALRFRASGEPMPWAAPHADGPADAPPPPPG